MRASKQQILEDLTRNLEQKLSHAINDYVGLCRAAKIPYPEAMSSLLADLVYLTAWLMHDEKELIRKMPVILTAAVDNINERMRNEE